MLLLLCLCLLLLSFKRFVLTVVLLLCAYFPVGSGRFMNLVVLYGYQAADADAEQIALTEQ